MKNSFLVLAVGLVLTAHSQSGDKFMKKGDYRSAAYAYENEVLLKPSKYFDMAKAYFMMRDIEKAISALENYKQKDPKANLEMADWWLNMLRRGDEPVKSVNMGDSINTSVAELMPLIARDGKRMYFAARKRTGGSGGYDIWYSDRREDGTWSNPRLIEALSTQKDEVLWSLSPDAQVALLGGKHAGRFGKDDIYYSVRNAEGREWSQPCNLGAAINTKAYEGQACMAADGQTILFVSNRSGGSGKKDIYMSRLTPNGWSTPVNVGSVINTAGDEMYPKLSADGKTLYFTSNGHQGFGGHDIFMARRLDDSYTQWSTPVNMGPYINTIGDEYDFSITTEGNLAYFFRKSPSQKNNTDIYRTIIPILLRPEKTVNVVGTVLHEKDSAALLNIKYTDLSIGREVARVATNASSGAYFTQLTLGRKYLVEINTRGFLYLSDTIDLSDIRSLIPRDSFKKRLSEELQAILLQKTMLEKKLNEIDNRLNSESERIKEEYEALLKMLAQSEIHLRAIAAEVENSRDRWLLEDVVIPDIVRNYKVQRSTVGASFELKDIYFDLGKATLTPQSRTSLDALYEILAKNDIYIELGGHTDSIGSDDNNLRLSQERVNAVKDYLVNKGINPQRIIAVGYGETRPVADNRTDEGRRKNRRVEVTIIDRRAVLAGTDDLKEEKPMEQAATQTFEISDYYSTLKAAANLAGLPKGSPCANIAPKQVKEKAVKTRKEKKVRERKVKPTDSDDTIIIADVKPRKSKRKRRRGGDIVIIDGTGNGGNVYGNTTPATTRKPKRDVIPYGHYIYKTLNLSYMNMEIVPNGLLSIGSFTGLQLNMSAGSFLETHLTYYLGGSNLDWGANLSQLFKINIGKIVRLPLQAMAGYRIDYFNLTDVTPLGNDKEHQGFISFPVGLRYNLAFSENFIIAPEYLINLNGFTSDEIGTARYTSIGIQARWKFLHGGLFMNRGAVINFSGFKVGVSF
ncbi:OmpA family protein [Thermaurantimonas aggregans]|uniref:OmpA family protein n=1 Tax=Thermaurantimonas aggregans TaxID=2173829 RepID=UPI0023EFC674|nr:OmpA family protein [Thermaurantimonas aggregans]